MRRRASRVRSGPAVEHSLVDDPAGWEELLADLAKADRYALDTEFHREGSYHPKVAVVQIAFDDRVAVVDALGVDLSSFGTVLSGPGQCVMHASRQDLEILARWCGGVPSRLYDTQIAASFVGYPAPSLASLLESELGIVIPKGDRLTDWLSRPLTGAQRDYAAADVAFLLDLQDRLEAKIAARHRSSWVEEACEAERTDEWYLRVPQRAWTRIKEVRQLRGDALVAAQCLAEWRERRASELDIPPRVLLSDMGVVTIARTRPRTEVQLRRCRGVEPRNLRGALAEEALRALEGSVGSEPQTDVAHAGYELPAALKPAIPLVMAWISQLSRDLELDSAVLATRADVEAFLAGDPRARLSGGWRAELVGTPLHDLIEGRRALAFEQSTGLVLESRLGAEDGR